MEKLIVQNFGPIRNVVASVLNDNPPVTKMPAAKTNSQHKNLEFEIKYNAILLTGDTYKFT
jgi:hypothetical protein